MNSAAHVSEAVGAFLETFPDIDVELEVTDRPVNLHDEGGDAAIMSRAHGDRPMNAHRLAPNPQVLVASSDYVSTHGKPSKPQQLEFHSCLVLGGDWHRPFEKRGKDEPVRVRGRLTANDCETILSAALA